MVWTYSDLFKLPCRSKFRLPDYIKCVRGSFPITEEAVFNFQEPDSLKNQIVFNAEDNLSDVDGSRRWDRFNLPCEGDSGMGHWMKKADKITGISKPTVLTKICALFLNKIKSRM